MSDIVSFSPNSHQHPVGQEQPLLTLADVIKYKEPLRQSFSESSRAEVKERAAYQSISGGKCWEQRWRLQIWANIKEEKPRRHQLWEQGEPLERACSSKRPNKNRKMRKIKHCEEIAVRSVCDCSGNTVTYRRMSDTTNLQRFTGCCRQR